jgi:two-component system nitrate/nitrite response regulator NarL
MVNILLIEDHDFLRQTLRVVLGTQPDFLVIAEASNGLSGLDLARKVCPDVIISAFGLPGLNGADIAQQRDLSTLDTRFILFSLYDEPAYMAYARSRGVARFVSKLATVDELFKAIRALPQAWDADPIPKLAC